MIYLLTNSWFSSSKAVKYPEAKSLFFSMKSACSLVKSCKIHIFLSEIMWNPQFPSLNHLKSSFFPIQSMGILPPSSRKSTWRIWTREFLLRGWIPSTWASSKTGHGRRERLEDGFFCSKIPELAIENLQRSPQGWSRFEGHDFSKVFLMFR